MPGLGLIKGISDDAAALLEAAGVEKPLDLATQDADILYPHLQTASRAMKRPEALPARAEIDGWIAAARALVETISPGILSDESKPSFDTSPRFRSDAGISARVNSPSTNRPSPSKAPVQSTPAVSAKISAKETDQELEEDDLIVAVEIEDDDLDAIPAVSIEDADIFDDDDELDDSTITAATLGIATPSRSVLPATRTNDFSKDADTLAHLEKLRERREVDMGFGSTKIKDEDDVWKDVDKEAFATFNDYQDGKARVQPLERSNADEEESRVVERVEAKPPEEEEEKISRLVRRGINYPHPVMGFCAAIFVLFFRFYMVAMIIGLPIALIQLGDTFNEYWMPTAIVIGIFFLLGVVNLIIISKVRCRVCSCPMFLSQRCFKNKKAHLVNGLGYVASLALHLVIFQWFRCMYCGTAIRVRGAAKTTRMEVLDAKALDVGDDDDDPIKSF